MNKKIYIIDRNGRMHVVDINDTLVINTFKITSEEHLEELLHEIFSIRSDLYIKSSSHVKVFDTKQLIGYQIVPVHE